MKQITIKELAVKIEAYIYAQPYSFNKNGWNKQHCRAVAGTWKDQLWYIDNVLKTFKDANISYDQDFIYIQYSTGNGKIAAGGLEYNVLFPYIEQVCDKHNARLTAINKHLLAA
jgi:hypothetical protein